MFEGGCREPTLAWWPGTIPAGTECNEPAMTIDLLPTIAKLIDADLPKHQIDGKDISALLTSKAKSPQEAYYFYYGNQLQLFGRENGNFIFHMDTEQWEANLGTGGIPTNYSQAKIGLSLFDLRSDIGETTDVKDKFPKITSRLKSLGEKFNQELQKTKRPAGKI